jgi:hypothetical protein
MTAIPEVLDALTAIWRDASPAGLRPDQVHDGPVVEYVGTEGVAVGASAEDLSVEFAQPGADLGGGSGEQATVTCLVWAGSGDTTMKPLRDRVDAVLDALETALAADRTLRGAVSHAWLTSGVLSQLQTGSGALVRAEIRVSVTRL